MPRKQCIGKTFIVGALTVTVEDVIAEGGFALVFLTRDNNGRRYALKRMYVNTERDLAMCQQEIHILESLAKEADSFSVRYLASTINVIDEEVKEVLILLDYYKYSVLQLMNERFQAKRQLSEEEVLNIFCDVCHAVGKLHCQRPPWIHRDLKVENILIDREGRCALCDFGSATNRILDPTKHPIADIEEDLKKYTTIAYRAPEMVNLYGIKRPITIKADIWALGVMLYKMCFFVLPFGESSLAIQNGNLQFPSQPVYSRQLHGLIRCCLKVDPEERPDIFQIAYLSCALANRECCVPNRNKCPLPSSDVLLCHLETSPMQSVAADSPPPKLLRQTAPQSYEFSSTSIAPRERPKASTPSASVLVLPPPPSKFSVPLQPAVIMPPSNYPSDQTPLVPPPLIPSLIDIAPVSNGSSASHSPFQPVTSSQSLHHFRNHQLFKDAVLQRPEDAPQRPQRIGHRRNTSDTSMIPVGRPMSPTPTQNVSEKSRSADNSPTRSPNPKTEVDKKFASWNPFEEGESWPVAKAAPSSLTQSITSLVRRGSVSSASRTTVVSPTENGDKNKIKPKTGEKKEKKKFKYQKFDNDSEEDLGSTSDLVSQNEDRKPHSGKGKEKHDADGTKDKDTDSIGSASDLKYEDDTTDDEHLAAHQVVHVEIKFEDEEDEEHYDTVQYGTLEETASAIQSLTTSHKFSVGQEASLKPLLDDHNGLDKSGDEEDAQRPISVVPVPALRRLPFDGMSLLGSVFDQIPFRQPKKSKDVPLIPPKKPVPQPVATATATAPPSSQAFLVTNPFSDCFHSHSVPRKSSEVDLSKNFEGIAVRFEKVTVAPVIVPPPVPPKPSFLKPQNYISQNTYQTSVSNFTTENEDMFGSSPFDDNLTESLVLDDKHNVVSSNSSTRKIRSKSPVPQDSSLTGDLPVAPGSPKASKSPNRSSKFRRLQEKEGISNISFEDA